MKAMTANEAFQTSKKLGMHPVPLFRGLRIKLPEELEVEEMMNKATTPEELQAAYDSRTVVKQAYLQLEQQFQATQNEHSVVYNDAVSPRLLSCLKTNIKRLYAYLAEQAPNNEARWVLLEGRPFSGDVVLQWTVHKTIIHDPRATEEDKLRVLKGVGGLDWLRERQEVYNSILDNNPSRETLLEVLREARNRREWDWDSYSKAQYLLGKHGLAELEKATSNEDRWKIFNDCWSHHPAVASRVLLQIAENGVTKEDIEKFNGYAKYSEPITNDWWHERYFVICAVLGHVD